MKIISDYKKEIGISLGTGIILICSQPLFNLLGNLLVEIFINLSEKYSNEYYKSIAINNENEFPEWNSFILNLFLTFFLFGILYTLKNRIKNNTGRLNRTLADIKKHKESLNNKEDLKLTPTQIVEKLNQNESKTNKLIAGYKKVNKLMLVNFTLGLILITIIFTLYSKNSLVSKENLTFKNDLIIISPYVTENQVELLKSNWALMKNSKDFDKIKHQINTIKKKNRIK